MRDIVGWLRDAVTVVSTRSGRVSRYDEHADWYQGWVARVAEDPIARATLALLPPLAGLWVLDLGWGEGRVAHALAAAKATVVGVDLSVNMLASSRQKKRCHR